MVALVHLIPLATCGHNYSIVAKQQTKVKNFAHNFRSAKNQVHQRLDWLTSLKQFFINVSYHILVASLALMALT